MDIKKEFRKMKLKYSLMGLMALNSLGGPENQVKASTLMPDGKRDNTEKVEHEKIVDFTNQDEVNLFEGDLNKSSDHNDKSDGDDNKELRTAIQNGDMNKVKELVANGADVNVGNVPGDPIWKDAIDNPEMLRVLAKSGMNFDVPNEDGFPALHYAIVMDNWNMPIYKESALALIDEGVDVNTKMSSHKYDVSSGTTALYLANDMEIVQKLVDKGADVNAITDDGKAVIENSSIEKMRFLYKVGAHIDGNYAGMNLMTDAAWRHDIEKVRFLQEIGMDINQADDLGWKPLKYASAQKNTMIPLTNGKICAVYYEPKAEFVQQMIDAGAKVSDSDALSVVGDDKEGLKIRAILEKKLLEEKRGNAENVERGKILDLTNQNEVDLSGQDLSEYDGIKFKRGAMVDLSGTEALCPNIDLSSCSYIDLTGREDLAILGKVKLAKGSELVISGQDKEGHGTRTGVPFPANIDINGCKRVIINNRDFSGCDDLKFAPGAEVDLSGSINIPVNTDFSKLNSVNLSGCDLSNFSNLRFKEGAEVDLSNCINIPQNIDFSKLKTVNLSECDLNNFSNLNFMKGANVDLSGCGVIPPGINFRELNSVSLRRCDLQNISELRFGDGAKVDLGGCKNIPTNTDFSRLSKIDLSKSDLSVFSNLQFKNGADVVLSKCKNIPSDFDFCRFNSVDLSKCDLNNIPMLNFSGKSVNLREAMHLPYYTNLADVDEVNLIGCDLSKVNPLNFKKNSIVTASEVPSGTDFSNCKEVSLNCIPEGTVKFGSDTKVTIRNALFPENVDFSSLPENVTIETCGFKLTKEIRFLNENQYEACKKAIPQGCKISILQKSPKSVANKIADLRGTIPPQQQTFVQPRPQQLNSSHRSFNQFPRARNNLNR